MSSVVAGLLTAVLTALASCGLCDFAVVLPSWLRYALANRLTRDPPTSRQRLRAPA